MNRLLHTTSRKPLIIGLPLAAVLAVGLLVFICHQRIDHATEKSVFDTVGSVPFRPVGLVLGTTPRLDNGRPNLYFEYRMDATAALYQAGKVRYLLLSGDNRRHTYNEPEEMKKALMERGVPESVLFVDYAGLRTLDSVVRAKEIFGQDSVTIISQRFHNQRAIYLADAFGLSAVGYNAPDVYTFASLKVRLREGLARVKVFIDLATGKRPRHLGEKIKLPDGPRPH